MCYYTPMATKDNQENKTGEVIQRKQHTFLDPLEFVQKYYENHRNGTATVKSMMNKPVSYDYAASKAKNMLKKQEVQEALQDYSKQALDNIKDLAENADNENVKLSANKDILDRSGNTPVQKRASVSGKIEDYL